MKCSKPPFSAASAVQVISVTSRSQGRPATSVTEIPQGRRSATSPSSRKTTRGRVGEDRGHVRGEERLAVAEPDHEGHVHPGADEPVRLATVHDRDGVGAVGAGQGVADRRGEVAVIGLLDEVGEGLRVGLGGQRVAARLQAVAQLAEVLDDPVVDRP